MTEPVEQSLSRLAASLALVRDDQSVEQSGRRVALYCDTSDAVAAVQGAFKYFDPTGAGTLRRDLAGRILFDQAEALSWALLGSGWLGPFRLLPPHGGEFARFLDDGRLLPSEGPRDRLVNGFFAAIGMTAAPSPDPPSIAGLTPDEILSLVKRHARTAERAFKAVQSILFSPQERLVRLHKQALLRSTPVDFDYLRLTRSKGFSDLLDAFTRIRQMSSANNYADSVALVMLRELCRRAEAGTLAEVPRFFDSTGNFTKMAIEAGIRDELYTRLPSGQLTSALVDTAYLVQKARFLPPRTAGSPSSPPDPRPLDPSSVLSRLRQITDDVQGSSDPGVVESILRGEEINSVPLRDILRDLTSFAFFQNVWLEDLASDELHDFADRFGKALIDTPEFQTELDDAIQRLRADLQEKAESFSQIYEAWHVLRDGLLRLRKHERERSANLDVDFEPIRDLELIRFGLPPHVASEVTAIILKLLDESVDENELVRLKRWSQLVEKYYATRRAPDRSLEAAQVTAAVLWVIKKDGLVVELLEAVAGKTDAISIDLLYAAACFRGASGRGSEMLDALNLRLRGLMARADSLSPEEAEVAIRLGIGVGYLSKHLWDRMGYQAWWPRGREAATAEPEGAELLRWAIESVRFAIATSARFESRGTEMRDLYALNQKLFYLTLLGPTDAEAMAEMSAAARTLVNQKTRFRALWLATFDDTLARYHHFRSRQAVDGQGALLQLRQALAFSEKAVKGAPHDDLMAAVHSVLVDEITETQMSLSREPSR